MLISIAEQMNALAVRLDRFCGRLFQHRVYYHYTDVNGYRGIVVQGNINSHRAGITRQGKENNGIFLCPYYQRFSPTDVVRDLMLARPECAGRGDYVFVMALRSNAVLAPISVSKGSAFNEVRYPKAIRFTENQTLPEKEGEALIIYKGPNRFGGWQRPEADGARPSRSSAELTRD